MKKKIFAFFLFLTLATLYAEAQRIEPRCSTCGRTLVTCPYKGKHPSKNAGAAKHKVTTTQPAKKVRQAPYTMSAEGKNMLHRLVSMPFGVVQNPTSYTTLREVEQAVVKEFRLKVYKMRVSDGNLALTDSLLLMPHYKGLYPDGDAFPLLWEGNPMNVRVGIDADGCLIKYSYQILGTPRAQAQAIAKELGADTPIVQLPEDVRKILWHEDFIGSHELGYFRKDTDWMVFVEWVKTFNVVEINILHKSLFNCPYYLEKGKLVLPENDVQALHRLVDMPMGMEKRPKRGNTMGYIDDENPYFIRSTPKQYGPQIKYLLTMQKEGFCLPTFRPPFIENVKTSAFKLYGYPYKLCAYGYDMEGLTPEQERFIINELEMQNTSPQQVYVPENDVLNQLFTKGVDPSHPEWAYVHIHGKRKIFLLLHEPTGSGSTQRRNATLWIWLDK